MFIFNLILIIFLIGVTFLLVALLFIKRIIWKINKGFSKAFSSNKKHNNNNSSNTINNLYKNKNTIKANQGEYVDFEEIKE